MLVTTLRVVWIEISTRMNDQGVLSVTTLRVVWIEIATGIYPKSWNTSPPCGWCGLKLCHFKIKISVPFVTTLRVVWIEIRKYIFQYTYE